jgi:exopolyphosphatase/guanosine-5'-triphosphate,3'-diphosphate pyrophosphatase
MSPTSYQTAPPRVAPHVLAKSLARQKPWALNRTYTHRAHACARSHPPSLTPPNRPKPQPPRPASTISPLRTAVVDIGTNSTRLLVADVDQTSGAVSELHRESQVTRLGDKVDAGGRLSDEAIARVHATLANYRATIDRYRCEANLAVLTSAVRDAANGAEFTAGVRSEFDLDAKVLSGDEEAQLTFLGAMSDRDADAAAEPTVVIDIGGGSTEFIVGADHTASFHVSVQAGVLRMSERHIHSDPPRPTELQELAADTRQIFLAGLPAEQRKAVKRAIAVAGTATSAAAIDQELEPYDPERVHGYNLLLATVELLLARLADLSEAQRREVVGLHPDRAPTIVAGTILLEESMKAFELDRVEVSEHDILRGGSLRLAGLD